MIKLRHKVLSFLQVLLKLCSQQSIVTSVRQFLRNYCKSNRCCHVRILIIGFYLLKNGSLNFQFLSFQQCLRI
jgi:hypothetical protein